MNLPPLPEQYSFKGPDMKVFWRTCLAMVLFTVLVAIANGQVRHYGAQPMPPTHVVTTVPNNLQIARAVQRLELKVKLLEAKVKRLQRGQ